MEMLVIPINRVADTKRIIGNNGGPRRRGTRGRRPPKREKKERKSIVRWKVFKSHLASINPRLNPSLLDMYVCK
jgi:hypothetical protein